MEEIVDRLTIMLEETETKITCVERKMKGSTVNEVTH